VTGPVIVEQYDPGDLLTDQNISHRLPDQDLIESIRDIGVLQPIIATRTAEGFVRVRMGHRRVLAAIEAERETVPVIVVADEADYAGQDRDLILDRVIAQFSENKHRQPLTAADEAGVAVQLLDLGLTARQVTARTRMKPADVDAARAIRQSKAATTAAAQLPQLTIEQTAAIAEFDTDLTVVDALVDAAADGQGKFAHALQRHRDERASAQARAALVEKLTADGVKIATEHPDWNNALDYLTDPDGKKLTARNHKKCPGHIAYITRGWDGSARAWQTSYYCTNPKANNHRSTRSSGGAVDSEKAKQERRETIARNKEWRAAEKVRRAWLRDFLGRKTPPDGALRYVLAAVADASGVLSRAMSQNHECARELLGLDAATSKWTRDTAAVTEALSRAADGRALVIVLGLALGAIEGETGVQTAVHPASQRTAAAYLAQIAGWGYELSEIEQRIVDAVAEAKAARDAEAAADAVKDGA
jgi:ParB family chromosome partitioning protein